MCHMLARAVSDANALSELATPTPKRMRLGTLQHTSACFPSNGCDQSHFTLHVLEEGNFVDMKITQAGREDVSHACSGTEHQLLYLCLFLHHRKTSQLSNQKCHSLTCALTEPIGPSNLLQRNSEWLLEKKSRQNLQTPVLPCTQPCNNHYRRHFFHTAKLM